MLNNKSIHRPRSNSPPPLCVLMADPDESLAPVYREPLLRKGFELDTAANGLECVARLRERVPDVLVLEPHMPWGGGVGVLAIMSEIPRYTTIPVMVLTSCPNPHVLAGIERFPINDYQVKPLTPNHLAERLRLLLNYPKLHFAMADHNGRLECAITRRTDGRVWDLRVEFVTEMSWYMAIRLAPRQAIGVGRRDRSTPSIRIPLRLYRVEHRSCSR